MSVKGKGITKVRWLLLYIERWSVAPLQKEDGTIVARIKGVQQSSLISPLMSAIYLNEVNKILEEAKESCWGFQKLFRIH
ncbi:MAG: hypothetical protein AAGU19_21935 [Prolixibacteraceae bacterium]